MVFSSVSFLYYFLPCVLILYFLSPKKLKNTVLLLTSLVFYAFGEPKFLFVMLCVIIQGYVFGILIEKHRGRPAKLYLAASCILSLSALVYCKYADFFISNFNAVTGMSVPLLNIALPIGISFYTFQMLSYVVDVYRGDVKCQYNFIDLAMYIAMFPQLIAGPIVRYSDIEHQLKNRTHSVDKAADGIKRFIIGLGQKVLIANVLGELCDSYRSSDDNSVLFVWLYAVAYTLHIFFDFSGYSSMAIGLAKIFGFDLMENFNYPYISGSITEFWRRWHMSLGQWFRDYVYIPLGGNRVKKWRFLCNIMIVWLLTGFWHGASWNFIIWGVYFGILLIIEKLWLKKLLDKTKVIKHIYVLFAVLLSFVAFDATSLQDIITTFKSLFGMSGLSLTSTQGVYLLYSYSVVLIIAVIASTPLIKNITKRLNNTRYGKSIVSICEPVFLLIILLTSTAYIVDGSFNPFLYFRF